MARVTQGPASHRVSRCSECGAANAVSRRLVGRTRCVGGCGNSIKPARPSGTPAERAQEAVVPTKGRVVVAERANRRTLVLPRG